MDTTKILLVTGVIKPNFQQFGRNLPVEVISLKSKDKGSERWSAKALISTIGMSSGQVLYFFMFLIFESTFENKIKGILREHKSKGGSKERRGRL
jgi:hypothetical protein